MSKVKANIKNARLEKQEILQAVVFSSDFTTTLRPMQDVFPTILTPVANAPLLDYLIETLIRYGVQEVFIYCSDHIEAIKNYIDSKNLENIIVISLIISDGCRSIGDALRDIDTKGSIRGDFVLIRGDAFINANLMNLMNQHRGTKERDKGTAMTLVLRDIGSTKKSILEKDSCLHVADKQTKKVLFYKKLNREERKIKFELEWFLDHDKIEINSGFIDTHVYICSSSVLPLFSDNFDFQTIEDFIRGVLMNEEILDARIYWSQLNSEDYAMPITSWPAFYTLTRDILQRQGYPLTPDMLGFKSGTIYTSRSTYKHRSAILERGCSVQYDTIIGEKSILGKNTTVTRSVIGEKCTIGDNVIVENSHILGYSTINGNCIIKNSVIFPNCSLCESVNVDGCIISHGVTLSPMTVYVDSIIEKNSNNEITCDKMIECNTNDYNNFVCIKKHRDNTESECSETDDTSIDRSSIAADSPIPDDTHMFLSEVIDSLLRGYEDKLNCDNLILEINSSRYAYNVGIREVTYNVVKAILMLPLHYLTEKKTIVNRINYQKTLSVMIKYFTAILLNYIKTEDAQEDCLRALEEVADTTEELLAFAQHLLHLFYEKDILSEEKILKWYYHENNDDDNELDNKKIRLAIEPFIKWLNEAEEDTSSNEDD